MGELELCPKCKKGKMRPKGEESTTVESDDPFTPAVHMQKLQCDNCSHIQKAASLSE
jgi:hypothetical protein